jgi:hypothetical protein
MIQPNYYVLHHHKYGVSVWLVHSDHVPSEQEVCAAVPDLASNYEPETGNEWLDIEAMGPGDEVFTVPPKTDADLMDTLRQQGRGIPEKGEQ